MAVPSGGLVRRCGRASVAGTGSGGDVGGDCGGGQLRMALGAETVVRALVAGSRGRFRSAGAGRGAAGAAAVAEASTNRAAVASSPTNKRATCFFVF
jgi:hypothetical protein